MRKIKLRGKYGEGKYVLVDNDDYDFLNQFKWFLTNRGDGYAGAYLPDLNFYVAMHKLVVDRECVMPKYNVVDHINRNTLDNRKKNLRVATKSENIFNSKVSKRNTSGNTGVSFHKKTQTWRARLVKDYKDYGMNSYKTKEEAIKARKELERIHFPNFYRYDD